MVWFSSLTLLGFLSLFVHHGFALSQYAAFGRKISDIPNPIMNPAECGRASVSRSNICDPDKLLSKDSKDLIEGYINAITTAEVSAVVINQMDLRDMGGIRADVESAAEKFARHLHDSYGVGEAGKNNGILLFLSVKDRAVHISTGTGVDVKLGAYTLDSVIENMKPHLRQREYGTAIEFAIIMLDRLLSPESKGEIYNRYSGKMKSYASPSSVHVEGGWFEVGVFACAFCGIILLVLHKNYRAKKLERGRDALDRLMREVENTENGNRFYAASCPVCLEDFPVEATRPTLTGSSRTASPSSTTETADDATSELLGTTPSAAVSTSAAAAAATPSASSSSSTYASTSTEGGAVDANSLHPRRPMALRCGHTFCHSCLDTYLRTTAGNKCPICRADVDGDDSSGGSGGGIARPNNQGGFFSSMFGSHGARSTGAATAQAAGGLDHIQRTDTPHPPPATSSAPHVGLEGSGSGTGASAGAGGGGGGMSCADRMRLEEAGAAASTPGFPTAGLHHRHGQVAGDPTVVMSEAPSELNHPDAIDHASVSPGVRYRGPAAYSSFARRAPEIRYRMDRMRYLYPDVMTYQVLRSMNAAVDRGSYADFSEVVNARSREVQRMVTEIRASTQTNARSSGRMGASRSSFGGGFSGGGGRGGRW